MIPFVGTVCHLVREVGADCFVFRYCVCVCVCVCVCAVCRGWFALPLGAIDRQSSVIVALSELLLNYFIYYILLYINY